MNVPKSSSSGNAIRITLLFMLILSGLAGWRYYSSQESLNGSPSAGTAGKGGPQKVTAVLVHPVSLPVTIDFSGSIMAWEEVQLMPEIAGRVTELNIPEGRRVEKGVLLVSLFDADMRAQQEKLKLQEGIALRNLERCIALLKTGSGTQLDADNAENQLNNIRADLKVLEANLLKTKIIAPFSGEIGFSNLSKGAWVNPGVPIATITETRKLKVEFSVPEQYCHLFEKGQPVTFTGIAGSDSQKASIYAIESGLHASTRTLSIRAAFSNVQGKWKPGAFVKVKPDSMILKAALILPSQSVIPDNKGKKVILFRNGKAEFREIQTGIRTRGSVQVISGISAGDTVLTTGLMFVKPASELILTKIESVQ